MAKETTAYLKCPECGAEQDLTGIDIGGLDLMPLPVHIRGKYQDISEPHNSMMFGEPDENQTVCGCSEHLVYVNRPDEPQDCPSDFTVEQGVKFVIDQLTPELMAYAKSPARGSDRGFAALHDRCDANLLLPARANKGNDTAYLNAVMEGVNAFIRQQE